MKHWKRTSEEMPEDYDEVLFMDDGMGDIFLGFVTKDGWVIQDAEKWNNIPKDEVVAWCPIPEYDLND